MPLPNPAAKQMVHRVRIERNANARKATAHGGPDWQTVTAEVACLVSDRTADIQTDRNKIQAVRKFRVAFAADPGEIGEYNRLIWLDENRVLGVTGGVVDHKGQGLLWLVEVEDTGPAGA
jgi:hypothetical protein